MIQVADPLLSPSESNALHIFFSQLDHMPLDALNLSPEWSMYVANSVRIPQDPKTELSRATKDLIALDSQYLGPSSNPVRHPVPQRQPQSQLLLSTFTPTQPLQSYSWTSSNPPGSIVAGLEVDSLGWSQDPTSTSPLGQSSNLSPSSSSSVFSTIAPSPALGIAQVQTLALPATRKRPLPPQLPQIITNHERYPNPATGIPHVKRPRMASPGRDLPPSSAPVKQDVPFPFSSPLPPHLPDNNQPSSSFVIPESPISAIAPSETTFSNLPTAPSHQARPERSPSVSQTSDRPTVASSSGGTSKATRPQSSSPHTHHHNVSQPVHSKPPLLSASQKKANHIQSEQKRRANIRKGYEALCDVVPALRDAILAEEAQCASTGKKRGRGRLLGEDGEKMDGRAGPRSESVVLQKTIEYMSDLLNQKAALLQQLQDAEMVLGPGHPAIVQSPYSSTSAVHPHHHIRGSRSHSHTGSHHSQLPHANQTTLQQSQLPGIRPWERIWDGGIGLPLNGDIDEQDDEDEGGSDDEE